MWGGVVSSIQSLELRYSERCHSNAPGNAELLWSGWQFPAGAYQQVQDPEGRFHAGEDGRDAGPGTGWFDPDHRSLQKDDRKEEKVSLSGSLWRVLVKGQGDWGPFSDLREI